MQWEVVIGLETHAQLTTQSKEPSGNESPSAMPESTLALQHARNFRRATLKMSSDGSIP